ncbi:GNAT family N-acetyltransferase [Cupriavidus sp. CuC1]|uniref:GNAT family N-acetyltransferase n=1 Tax=Cupriavidus sp. CuC1 TaxID=3373131 RepID=UPI0037CFC302
MFLSYGLPGSDVDPSARLCSLSVLGEKVIGCACGEKYGETVIIQAVAVLHEYQGHQVASHLIGAILMRARADDCTRATVLTSDHPTFFARFGFFLTALDDMPQECSCRRNSFDALVRGRITCAVDSIEARLRLTSTVMPTAAALVKRPGNDAICSKTTERRQLCAVLSTLGRAGPKLTAKAAES